MESRYLFDRLAAVAIFSSVDREDATWHALAGALLETDGSVRGAASLVLAGFARELPRRVDRRPATAELHAILNGGNLFDLHTVLGLLVTTGADESLARPRLAPRVFSNWPTDLKREPKSSGNWPKRFAAKLATGRGDRPERFSGGQNANSRPTEKRYRESVTSGTCHQDQPDGIGLPEELYS